jgi:hypothetical protein
VPFRKVLDSPEGFAIKYSTPTGDKEVDAAYSQLGVFILDYSKYIVHQYVRLLSERPLGQDYANYSPIFAVETDGFFFSAEALPRLLASTHPVFRLGTELGNVTDEFHGKISPYAMFVGKKFYAVRAPVPAGTGPLKDPNYCPTEEELKDSSGDKFACKGISKKLAPENQMNLAYSGICWNLFKQYAAGQAVVVTNQSKVTREIFPQSQESLTGICWTTGFKVLRPQAH